MESKFNIKNLNPKQHNPADESFDFSNLDLETKKTITSSNPTPKEALITFLNNNTPDEPYTISINATLSEGDEYLHRMRNELSRFRAKLRARGLVPKQFKVICDSIAIIDDVCEIVLIRSDSAKPKPDPDLDSVMDALSI